MSIRLTNRQRALFSIHIAAILFGLTGIFGAIIQTSAFMITFGRASFAVFALIIYAQSFSKNNRGTINFQSAFQLIKSGIFLTIHWVTFFIAVKQGGVALATLGFASFPAFITLIEYYYYHEKVELSEWITLACVLLGLLLITPTFSLADTGTIAFLWGIVSGITFALLTLSNRYTTSKLPPIQVAAIQNGVVALILMPFIIVELPSINLLNWFNIAMLGILCTGLSHVLFVSSLSNLKARTVGMILALEPVYAIFFAWILFSQNPTFRMILGGTLILGAILSSELAKKKS